MTDKEIKAYKHRLWREANPEKHLASVRRWQIANADKVKAYKRAWYQRRKAARLSSDA
jgi:hypothetical protein